MKKITLLLGLLVASISALFAQVPMASEDVMLQGFYWNSYQNYKNYGTTKWTDLKTQASEIAATFDLIWLPPSAKSSGGTGYIPEKWCDQGESNPTAWGNKTDLKNLISTLKAGGCKTIADIVINHRGNQSSWTNFHKETFGSETFQLNASHICSDDEARNGHGNPTGNPDSGYGNDPTCDGISAKGAYCAARDLDHSNTYVQDAIKAYLKWMKSEMGYEGWRYDLVKGYWGGYTKIYNNAAAAYISVGEYWDGNYDALKKWIQDTGYTSMAFDFAFKYAMNNWGGGDNYSALTWTSGGADRLAGLVHSAEMRQYAVTFIDNHDTANPHEDPQEFNMSAAEKANAIMLSNAGIPCVFYPHWVKHKAAIKNMINARKAMGINSNSDVKVTNKSGYYESVAIGTKGTLICRVGNWSGTPSGYTEACSGNGWAYYTSKEVDPIIPDPDVPVTKTDITVKFKAPASWTKCHIWAWDSNDNNLTNAGEWPGTTAMTKNADGTYSYTVKNVPGTLNFLFNDGVSGGEQTADASTTSNSCWVAGSKNSSNENKYDITQNATCDLTPSDPEDPEDPEDPDTPIGSITLKVKASSLPWGNKCYLYTWDGGELGAEVKYTGEWPGTAMTLGSDGFYTYTVNQSMVYAIFTDGSASGTLQTDDIQNITASTCYEISSEQHDNMLGAASYDAIETACPEPDPTPDPTPDPDPVPTPDPTPGGSITLKVKASSLPWGNKCYLYTWDGGELGAEVKYTGEWPGTAMTLGSDGFYTYTVNQSMVYAIFTDGSASGTLQTDDIQNITASTCYELSSEQHENMLGAMVYDAIETACPEPVSIIETEAVELNIYPNPTNDYINVDCAEEISEVVISALNGSEVIRTKSTYIDLSSLNPSMYFVNIMLQNGDVLVSKVIRK